MARSLWPREHGVYVQVMLPLLTGLLISSTLAGAFISSAVFAAFLLHEPMLVLTGGRGRRMEADLAVAAKTRVVVVTAWLLVAGGAGYLLAPASARLALLSLLVCGASVLFIARRHAAKTLHGELLVAFTFSLALLPVVLAGRESILPSWVAMGIWTAVFGLQTLTVHAVKARGGFLGFLTTIIAVALLVAAVLGAKMIFPMLGALSGPALVSIVVMASRPGQKRLKRIGWAFVCADITALVVILLAWPS